LVSIHGFPTIDDELRLTVALNEFLAGGGATSACTARIRRSAAGPIKEAGARKQGKAMARFEMTASEMSASGSSADAFFSLGLMYCIGREVEQDYVAAHKWFNLAALKGSLEAKKYRCEISREMSPGDIAEAQRMARDWISIH
jgi:TPR repeat protein